jgi:archaellum component FlaF (FlaF/FlaG flagellin family)
VSETATDATVQLADFTVTVTVSGQTVKQKMSDVFSKGTMVVRLKYSNGKWLLTSPTAVPGTSLLETPLQEAS